MDNVIDISNLGWDANILSLLTRWVEFFIIVLMKKYYMYSGFYIDDYYSSNNYKDYFIKPPTLYKYRGFITHSTSINISLVTLLIWRFHTSSRFIFVIRFFVGLWWQNNPLVFFPSLSFCYKYHCLDKIFDQINYL